jgi:hypothetical protein
MTKGVSQRALARRLKVDEKAVRKAIKRRLLKSVTRGKNGQVRLDPKVAAAEWKTNAAKPPAGDPVSPLVEVQRQVGLQRARQLEIANEARLGRLVSADRMKREQFEAIRMIRDAVLNMPTRIAAQLEAETDAGTVFKLLEDELRLTLEGVAVEMDKRE